MAGHEKLEFPGSQGVSLAARLELPHADVSATALFAHCFTCGKDVRAASQISRSLASLGMAVLRFDFTGIGDSEGEFANKTFTANVEDVVAAAQALEQRLSAPKLLIGHSLGGAAVLAAARRIEEVAAVATIGAPAQPAHVRELLAGSAEEIEREGEATVEIAGREFQVGRELLEDLERIDLGADIGSLGRALLVFHSPTDDTVGIDNARLIFDAARHPKSFVTLSGADHLLSHREDGQYVADVIASWVSRYL
ncbi:MAG: alpha/beta hydrolase family protein [Solirubrobacterales bacterium]